jgi:hypothetical protein
MCLSLSPYVMGVPTVMSKSRAIMDVDDAQMRERERGGGGAEALRSPLREGEFIRNYFET